jgi:DNA-binding MarR family transcriptional regulator
MEKNIPIKTTEAKFYRQYLELINPLLKLRGKELDVLAALLLYNNDLKNIPEEHRWKIIFDYDTKTKIRTELDLSDASMNNNLSALRKKGIIENNQVLKNFLVYPNGAVRITFNFNLKDGSDD